MSDPFKDVEPRYVALFEDALMNLENNARRTPPEKIEAVAANQGNSERLED